MLKFVVPRWYQELSLPQMQRVFALEQVINCDHEETVTGRTQKLLREVGITSWSVKLSSKDIKKFQKLSNLDPAMFLCEIYRHITGNYFEDEGYKKFYDCNERLVLTAIAILKLSETIMELHRRLPMGDPPKVPDKPIPVKPTTRRPSKSPYLEELFELPNWRLQRSQMEKWREKASSIIKPQTILPAAYYEELSRQLLIDDEPARQITGRKGRDIKKNKMMKSKNLLRKRSKSLKRQNVKEKPQLSDEVAEEYVESEDDTVDDLINKLKKNTTKVYNPGRENLSIKWQSWFHQQEEDFNKLEKKANCLLNNVRDTTKLIFNPDNCDNCCACRQTRTNDMKKRLTSVPRLIIDSLTLDEDGNKNIIGSLALISPAESLTESMLNRPRLIPSRETIVKKMTINGIMTDGGKTKYILGEIINDRQYSPRKMIKLPAVVKNVAPCGCKTMPELTEELSCQENGVCVAKKYRKNECHEHCSDERDSNNVFLEFEKACRERDKRIKEAHTPIPVIKKTIQESKKIETPPEKCKKCLGMSEKCQPSPFKDILQQIENEKLAVTPKPAKKSEIKIYKDNIKFSLGGIGNDEGGNNHFVLSGVTLQTPITISPASTSESDLPHSSMSHHRHWSVTSFTPKQRKNKPEKLLNAIPKRRPSELFKREINELFDKVRDLDAIKKTIIEQQNGKKEQIIDKEVPARSRKLKSAKKNSHVEKKYKKIRKYEQDLEFIDEHEDLQVNQKEIQNQLENEVANEKIDKENENINANSNNKISADDKSNIEEEDDVKPSAVNIPNEVTAVIKEEKKEEIPIDDEKFNKTNQDKKEKDNEKYNNEEPKPPMHENINNLAEGENKETPEKVPKKQKQDLAKLMKIALENMAEEGYLLAKLPQSYKMPQLQSWIMFREGFVITAKLKRDMLEKTQKIWKDRESDPLPKVSAPPLEIPKKLLTHADVQQFQRQIELKKKLFYSKVRKLRVAQSRAMWNLMDYEMFSSLTFKKAYFVYQAAKESDGKIIRPYGYVPSA